MVIYKWNLNLFLISQLSFFLLYVIATSTFTSIQVVVFIKWQWNLLTDALLHIKSTWGHFLSTISRCSLSMSPAATRGDDEKLKAAVFALFLSFCLDSGCSVCSADLISGGCLFCWCLVFVGWVLPHQTKTPQSWVCSVLTLNDE